MLLHVNIPETNVRYLHLTLTGRNQSPIKRGRRRPAGGPVRFPGTTSTITDVVHRPIHGSHAAAATVGPTLGIAALGFGEWGGGCIPLEE